jgi:hypothetical protein
VRYASGEEVLPGDIVRIDLHYRGTVVACISDARQLSPQTPSQWEWLRSGVLIDTDFGGLVHYPGETDLTADSVELIGRAEAP